MRTNMKIFGIAAILTSVSGAALAQEAVETQVPKSLEDSRLVEQGGVDSVTTFTEEQIIEDSAAETDLAETGDITSTEVAETDDDMAPESLATSRLAEAGEIEAMDDPSYLFVTPMADAEGAVMWEDEQAAEMRSAILANTMVSSELKAQGYNENDVVAAYTNAEGGLTILVD
ncbi:MAG: hypothetical protein ACPH5G_00815 [Pseudooceanicola atlanticus]